MPPHHLLASLSEFVGGPPNPVLPPGRVTAARPAVSSDLPMLSVGLALERDPAGAPARFVREGDQVVRHSTRVAVQSGANGFASDRLTLDLAPLPVKRRPPGIGGPPEPDVMITNVASGAPAAYELSPSPSLPNEFRIDFVRGRVAFGAPQEVGDALEVVHWTVARREPIRSERFQGTLVLEAWSASGGEGASLSDRLQDCLARVLEARPFGFLRLVPVRVEPGESVLQATGSGAAFPAWRQRLDYAFAYEGSLGGEESEGAPIHRIDVTIDDAVGDSLTVGR
jgi:hypothetical protein